MSAARKTISKVEAFRLAVLAQAAALNVPAATVKVKVHRARLKLAAIRNQGVSAK